MWIVERPLSIVLRHGHLGIATIVMLVLLGLVSASARAQGLPRTILLLDQGSANYPMAHAIVSAFQSEINAQAKTTVPVIVESLNLAVFGDAHHIELLRDYLLKKYRNRPISVIVARGPILVPYAIRMRDELWPGTPLVFVDVAARTIAEMKLPPNVTGVTHNPRLQDMVDVARALVPNLSRIAVVGDSSKNSPRATRSYTQDLPAVAAEIGVIDLTGLPLAEVKRRVSTLPSASAIIYWTLTVDGTGAAYVSRDVLKSLVKVANRPIVIDVDTSVGTGAVGGPIQSAAAVGQVAARLAWRVLDGENPSSIPVRDYNDIRLVFDWRALQRWSISEKRLPAGSEIRFRLPTAWQQYRWQITAIAAALVLQSLLIGWLFYEHRRRNLAELETRRRMGELAHMNRSAAVGEMSASIAHEINQPLAAIVTNGSAGLRWLNNSTPNIAEASEAFKRIVSNGHRASQVVGTIRAMFKKDIQQKTPIDINDLVRDVLVLLHIELEEIDVAVKTVLADGIPPVLGDRTQLQQVILNLVRNAVDAMSAVNDRARTLHIRSECDDSGDVIVSIKDSGIGIDPENMDRIFEPFFTTKSKGMGMGLSICHSIVDDHGGSLSAEPIKPHGSLFQLVLPLPR
jgi:signal transduction histidine kinase